MRWYKAPQPQFTWELGCLLFFPLNFIDEAVKRRENKKLLRSLHCEMLSEASKGDKMRLIPNRLFVLFVLSKLRQLCNASGQKCYSPDGNIMALGRPCLPKLDVSPCCGLGWECLANGICHDVKFPPVLGLARGGCTESPWKSGYCPNFCKGKGSEYFPLLYCFYQSGPPVYNIVTRN